MSKSSNSKRKVEKVDLSVSQISDIAPLARRNKKEEKLHQKVERFSKEVNEEGWVKAVKLMKGEWTPFPEHLRCYERSKVNKLWVAGVGGHQKLVLEFKKAVLSQNWTNAVKLAVAIFKNFSAFNERVHLKVLITLLMSHPKVNEKRLTDACSFLWQMENKEAMAELIRCFCSMPKSLPTEFISTVKNRTVYVRSKRDFKDKKSLIEVKYTAHLGKGSKNDMYIE